jgi:hypothetical protein
MITTSRDYDQCALKTAHGFPVAAQRTNRAASAPWRYCNLDRFTAALTEAMPAASLAAKPHQTREALSKTLDAITRCQLIVTLLAVNLE